MIVEYGKLVLGYQSGKWFYVVFDWDNISIMNDCEEVLLMYQINMLFFKLILNEFVVIICQNVLLGLFSKDFKNVVGNIVDLEVICVDFDVDYVFLYVNYKGMVGSKSLEEIIVMLEFQDFCIKFYYFYEVVNDIYGVVVGYLWVIYFFVNMSVVEVSVLVEVFNDVVLGVVLIKVKYISLVDCVGKVGVVSVLYFYGICLCIEIVILMDILCCNGIDVYVCIVLLEDVVVVFVMYFKYGYYVICENVIGLCLECNGQSFCNVYLKEWLLIWGLGKMVVIKQVLVV